jgi:transcriptional regulator GlxA family with amidase domain
MATIGTVAIIDIIRAMRIYVLALDGVFDTGISVVLDALQTANELAEMTKLSAPRFDVTAVGMRREITTSLGHTIPTKRAGRRSPPDWVIVPALGFKMPGPLQAALARPDVREATKVLRTWANRDSNVAAACIGTFVLAESGLLDDHEATTTWWLSPLFRQRYPRVRLDESRMIVSSGNIVTAGAALSHMDMALWLIRRTSPKLAALTAKYLIVDSRPSQSAYIVADHLAHSDPLVERFERWVRGHLAQGFSLDAAAEATRSSKRTLGRRLQSAIGKSPLTYFQELRVEHAVHLLKTTRDNVDAIAAKVGYGDGITLRNLLRKQLGVGVREIRRYR